MKALEKEHIDSSSFYVPTYTICGEGSTKWLEKKILRIMPCEEVATIDCQKHKIEKKGTHNGCEDET